MTHPVPGTMENRRRDPRAARRCLGAALLLAPFLAAPAAAAGDGDRPAPDAPAPDVDPATAEVQRVLRRARDPESPAPEEAALELAPHARAALPLLLEVLRARQVPEFGEEPPQTLSEPQEAIVLGALAALDRAVVVEGLRRMLEPERLRSARDAALRVLSAVGTAEDLDLLLELPLGPGEEVPHEVVSTSLSRAVAGVVHRDATALVRLERLWHFHDESLLPAVIRGLGEARDPRSLALLDDVLLRHGDLAPLVMAQVRRIGPSDDSEVNEDLARTLRRHLDPIDPSPCRAACHALAMLRDFEAVPRLIELLVDESPGLRADAHHALRALTHEELRADVALWDAWYARETAWIDERSPAVLSALGSSRDAEVAAAVSELAQRKLFVDQWAWELVPLLRHRSASIRALAARALGSLRSPYVTEALVDTLGDGSEPVREAAAEALRAITGLALPPDAERWRDALASDARP